MSVLDNEKVGPNPPAGCGSPLWVAAVLWSIFVLGMVGYGLFRYFSSGG